MRQNLTKYNINIIIKEEDMKFHIIENDYIKEYQKEKYNTKLKLVTNDIDYSDIDDLDWLKKQC